MLKTFKGVLALAICLSFLTVGCIGQMGMVRKVRDVNLELSDDRWGREIIFVVFLVLPIYQFSALADVIVFNSIEFWTGKNPVNNERSISPVADLRTFEIDDTSISMRLRDDESIDLEAFAPDGKRYFLNLIRTDQGIVARNHLGAALVRAPRLDESNGRVRRSRRS